MSNSNLFQVEKTSEQLIGVNFKFQSGHKTFFVIFMNSLVKIAFIIIHNNIQVLFVILISKVWVFHGEYIWVMEHFKDI